MTNQEQKDNREKILEAAVARFEYFGYKKTTVDEIAEDAGISKGAVYLHFNSKEEIILEAMLRHVYERVSVWDEIAAENIPADKKIDRMFRSYVEKTLERTTKVFKGTHPALMEEDASGKTKEKFFRTVFPMLTSKIAEVVESGKQEGTFRTDLVAEELAMVVLTLIKTSMVLTFEHLQFDWKSNWESTWKYICNGIMEEK